MANILHIIPYQKLFPPQNGGALRCFHLLKSLASFNKIDLITFQDKEEIFTIEDNDFPSYINIFHPSDFTSKISLLNIFPDKLKNALLFRFLTNSYKGPAEATLLKIYPILKVLLREKTYDVVIFEHLQSMMAAKYIRKLSPTTKLILDAHNVDHILVEKELKYKNEVSDSIKIITRLKEIESSLSHYVDAVLACSTQDEEIFRSINRENLKSTVIPNGVDVENKPYHFNKISSASILFCGDLTTAANKDGLLWFYKEVFPIILKRIPDASLVVVGTGADDTVYDELKKNQRISFTGRVNDVVSYYKNTFVAVAPLRIGSGTRLKILEAMSLGNPVVSTAVGAEGVNYPAGAIVIADNAEDFALQTISLIQEPKLANEQRLKAREFIEKEFAWSTVGNKLNSFIQQILKNEE